MEQIVVQVKDKAKAKVLLELLAALDFVDSVKTGQTKEQEVMKPESENIDFFSLAGLWENRAVNLGSLRAKAWPRQLS